MRFFGFDPSDGLRLRMTTEEMNIQEGLSFDDVLLIPQYSKVRRSQVDLQTKLTKKITLKIPLVSSPMDTVTESQLATSLASVGGIGIIHRNLSIAKQVNQVLKVKREKKISTKGAVDKKERLLVGAAVGMGEDLRSRLKALKNAEVDVVVLDSAHGESEFILKTTKMIKQLYPNWQLISGNVATCKGFERLAQAGADAIRVGLGSGSICTTRIVTGVGAPQLSAIMDCAHLSQKYQVGLIADGGIRFSGDIVKALAAGAWTTMIGSLFASLAEACGKTVMTKGGKYKYYRGMGSAAAMRAGSASRYGQRMRGEKLIAEGAEGLVPYKGKLPDFVFQLLGGVRSGMAYVGAQNIQTLWKKGKFVQITRSGLIESHPHDLLITNPGENY